MTLIEKIGAAMGLMAAVGGAVGAIATVVRLIRPVVRRFHNLADDVLGEPPRPSDGFQGRPGFGARLATMEVAMAGIQDQMVPNHGSSLRDAVDGVRLDIALLAGRQEQVERRLTQHITHGGH